MSDDVTLSRAAFLSYQEGNNKFTLLVSMLGIEFERLDAGSISLEEFRDRIRYIYQRI
jgi:hypothetical protein